MAAGCGGGGGDHESSESAATTTTPPVELVQVPNVIGDKADDAAARLEKVRLGSIFRPRPDDADLCRVRRQSASGRVELGTEITLRLDCKVVVPDVVGERLADAAAKVDKAGELTVSVEGEASDNEDDCTVVEQDERGKVEAGTEVALTIECAMTVAEVKEAATSLARKSAIEDGGDYDVHDCEVVGDDEGQCEVLYFDVPGGIGCTATLVVIDDVDTIRAYTEDADCY
jgi:hypothetical protein